jgi:N-acetylglucosamine-6-phosphate deacetylase
VCEGGRLVDRNVVVSNETGRIVDGTTSGSDGSTVDLGGAIVGPGLIELQTNGMRGFHFTHFEDEQSYAQKVEEVARYLPSTGCTSFYATIPTVSSDDFKKVFIIGRFRYIDISLNQIL